MSSSKFASPFLNKSPLYGAYYSGADGMVTVSYADIHKDFQKGLSDNVAKARAMHDKKNVNNCVGLDDKLLSNKMSSSVHTKAKKICAERNKKPDSKKIDTKSFENIMGKKPFADVNMSIKTKPFEGASVSDYKKSNETNPFYVGQGYKAQGPKVRGIGEQLNDALSGI